MRRLLAVLLVACNAAADPIAPRGDASLHVLFVGNSLTYYNDLPGMLRELGESAGVTIDAQMVAKPNFALEDHWADGEAPAAIARGGWDVVILQQGPSALPASRSNLLQWADSFALRIRAAGAEPALYQVWPAGADLAANFDASLETYRLAAVRVNGRLLPAGGAWKLAWQRNAALELYGPDEFHPSWLGSYLAAITIYGRLTGRSPATLPAAVQHQTVPAATLLLLRQASADAIASASTP